MYYSATKEDTSCSLKHVDGSVGSDGIIVVILVLLYKIESYLLVWKWSLS